MIETVTFNLDLVEVVDSKLDWLLKQPSFAKLVDSYQLGGEEMAILCQRNEMVRLVEPGERLVVWKDAADVRVEVIPVLEKVAERIDRITVVGGLDQVLNNMVTINPVAANGSPPSNA